MTDIFKQITRPSRINNSITTRGKIVDAQYEISICKTVIDGPDPASAVDNVDGLMIRPGFTKSQWLNCQ
jgi:hypothetical protein